MTDKEFVQKIYPQTYMWPYHFQNHFAIKLEWENFTCVMEASSEEEAWAVIRKMVNNKILGKLGH